MEKQLIGIDSHAPLSARREIIIKAPAEKVWQVISEINRWPAWQPGISSALLKGDLKAGELFLWKALGMNITSRLHTVQPNQRIGWTGKSPGLSAVHNWTLEAQGDSTRAITEESLSGWLAHMLVFLNPRFLEKSLEVSLQRLKKEAES